VCSRAPLRFHQGLLNDCSWEGSREGCGEGGMGSIRRWRRSWRMSWHSFSKRDVASTIIQRYMDPIVAACLTGFSFTKIMFVEHNLKSRAQSATRGAVYGTSLRDDESSVR
jgi:hypothetical protein